MIRRLPIAAVALAFCSQAHAVDFAASDSGLISFVMPSGNIGCIYTPAGGTDVYMPSDGGPELSCDRVEPTYLRVTLGRMGKAQRLTDVADASCCGADNVFDYGETWAMGPFACRSETAGLVCRRGAHGFAMSRRSVSTY